MMKKNKSMVLSVGVCSLCWLMANAEVAAQDAPATEPTPALVPEAIPEIAGKRVVGYAVAGKHELFDDPATRDFIFPHITHVVLLGATHADAKGIVSADEKLLGNAVAVTHAKGRKISATFTGPCRDLFADSGIRTAFVTNVLEMCRKYRFDGADFDYEYPGNMEDRLNFEAFLKELRTAAPKELLISVAVSAWDNASYLVPAGAVSSLDWVFLMAYGPRPSAMKRENQVRQMQNCLKWGVPAPKLIFGLPLYGSKLGADGKPQDGPGYAGIIGTHKLDRTLDEFNGWHFNGPATIEKNTQYVYDNGMGGVGWWYPTCDALDDRSLLLTTANKLRTLAESDKSEINAENPASILNDPVHAQEPTPAKQNTTTEKEVIVGVNYFAGWWKEMPNKWHGQGWILGQPDWRPKFPERVPTLGEYNDQATMDREIIAASSHGVDFFAILWYYPKTNTEESKHVPMLNRGLEQFIASPEAHRMRFCIEYCNAPSFSAEGDEQWAECIPTWVEAMKHPSYLRVDGRLVFKVHDVTGFLRANDNGIELCRKRLDTLRDAVREAGLGQMIIGVGISGQTPSLGRKWPVASVFDFTGTYMSVPEVEEREAEHPYATLAAATRETLAARIDDPLPWMPYLTAGWNPRPWHYPTADPHYQRFFTFPTRAEFTAELQNLKQSLTKHPSLGLPKKDGTTQKAFTIYAWNEFGEGGIVAPTKGNGTMMLEAINEVFGK